MHISLSSLQFDSISKFESWDCEIHCPPKFQELRSIRFEHTTEFRCSDLSIQLLKNLAVDINPNMPLEKPGEDAEVSGFESEETEPDSELDELELEVNEMAQRILHYRSTLSAQLKSSFFSLLESSRPVAIGGSEPGVSVRPDLEDDEQTTRGEGTVLHDDGLETAKKIQLLKDKISSNITMIPTVLKRMKDCISTIDNLDSYNGVIHPAFKRKKTS